MNMTHYMVFWLDIENKAGAEYFENMGGALAFMQKLRLPELGNTFITMASESEDNVGKMGVDAIVDGKCPDGTEFQGRTSRYGMFLKRGR